MRSPSMRIPVGGGLAVSLAVIVIVCIIALRPGGIVQLSYGPKQIIEERGKSGLSGSKDARFGFKGDAPIATAENKQKKLFKIQAGAQAVLGDTTQYEPYYLTSQYAVTRNESQIQLLDSTTPTTTKFTARTRAAGGFQESTYARPIAGTIAPATVVSRLEYDRPVTQDESWRYNGNFQTEDYSRIYENRYLTVRENPLSTFSIDVDTASYSNIRRFLTAGQLPPADAVRIEEMINYFSYDYPQPEGEEPFSITTKVAAAPWNSAHQLMMVGLQGKTLQGKSIPPSNLVFLIDVSGSMEDQNKLPLLKSAFRMMTQQLSESEKISIVVYAGAAGVVLEPTTGANKQKILEAIDRLQAGGSTAGGAGIQRAYDMAAENFIKGGNNRVILATDGDFNVGTSSDAELVRLIEEKRKSGVFLTVLGFGTGNYKDNKMEQLANKGNGNFYYIDTTNEAQKVLVSELGSTLFTIAKDVKVQIEFNPAKIKAYRLVGYENRILAKEDFNDDTKDAGELGAGHSVTAIYELVPVGSEEEFAQVDALKYQQQQRLASEELLTVKLRYKQPQSETSQLISNTITSDEVAQSPSGDFQFAAAVAEFGMLLRQSEFKHHASYEHVISAAQSSNGEDAYGYRAEFIDLVRKAQNLDSRPQPMTEDGGIRFK